MHFPLRFAVSLNCSKKSSLISKKVKCNSKNMELLFDNKTKTRGCDLKEMLRLKKNVISMWLFPIKADHGEPWEKNDRQMKLQETLKYILEECTEGKPMGPNCSTSILQMARVSCRKGFHDKCCKRLSVPFQRDHGSADECRKARRKTRNVCSSETEWSGQNCPREACKVTQH